MIPVKGAPSWRIGDGSLMQGRVASSMIMHRAELPALWISRGDEDWQLMKAWDDAGIPHTTTGYASVTYRPSGGADNRDFVVVPRDHGHEVGTADTFRLKLAALLEKQYADPTS